MKEEINECEGVGVERTLEFDLNLEGRRGRRSLVRSNQGGGARDVRSPGVPRIARLMALALRLEELVHEQEVRNYAEIARLSHVTLARMTQIMQLRLLAPDIQETLLFLSEDTRINERNLRPVVGEIDWSIQRRRFEEIIGTGATR